MIFIDLDGPILDVSDRYYRVYNDILHGSNSNMLSKEIYWELKQNIVPEKEIHLLSNTNISYMEYNKRRGELLEAPFYLKHDSLQSNAKEILKYLSEHTNVILVTLRRLDSNLHDELKHFKIHQYFTAILFSNSDATPRWSIKYNLIRDYLGAKNTDNHVLIGDTETDIEAGNRLNMVTIAISNGIRSETILKRSCPNYIFSSINDYYQHYNDIALI